jgi:transcriptional regulator with XRE-family HTH domain
MAGSDPKGDPQQDQGPFERRRSSASERAVLKKSPNNIDKHVGTRLRVRRMSIGMSQEKLGEALGLTFQQVQKYEKGTNRIGASRLQQIASILGVAPAFFFEDMPAAEPPGSPQLGFAEDDSGSLLTFLSSAEGLQLTRAFVRIKDPKVRRKVIDLVATLGGEESLPEPAKTKSKP